MCTTKDIGEFFLGKSDDLVLAFDRIMTEVMAWRPNDLGASIHSVVFTNRKAWLIIKPMKKELDVKFYHSDDIDSSLIKKRTRYHNKSAYHFRISSEKEVTAQLIDLLRMGYNYAME